MAFDPDRVSTITVDSYSTLVDVDSVERALAARVGDPEPISRRWRARSLQYTMVANHLETYETFYELNRAALEYALEASDVSLSAAEREEILETYHELAVFEDVRDGLARLAEGGDGVFVLSNGNPAMLASMVDHAGIEDLLAGVISADEIETYKPSRELYRHAAARTGTPIAEIAHASALPLDVQGATNAGMQGVWIDRQGSPWELFGPEPDLTVETFHELADELGA